MSADVSGYSRMMDEDEEATLATLKTYRKAMQGFIERHRGRVFNTAGDSVLAEFPSVVEAVQCAAEIQQELSARNETLDDNRRMDFRIGLNLGDVMVEGDDLYGEGVNVASRLQALAEPGGICISGAVYEQVHHKLTLAYDFIGPQPVKNIVEPVPVYRVALDGKVHNVSGNTGQDAPVHKVRRATSGRPLASEGRWAGWIYRLFLASVLFGVCALAAGAAVHRDDVPGQGGKIEGDITFSESTRFGGDIEGNVFTEPEIELIIVGKVGGSLTVAPGAVVEVRGKVEGDVINQGGTFRIFGKVEGTERREPRPGGARPPPGTVERESRDDPRERRDEDRLRGVVALFVVLTALTSVGGVVLAYIHRGADEDWIDGHYRFQIRTFWIGVLLTLIALPASLIGVGIIVLILLPFWVVIRSARGLRCVSRGEAHPDPGSWVFG